MTGQQAQAQMLFIAITTRLKPTNKQVVVKQDLKPPPTIEPSSQCSHSKQKTHTHTHTHTQGQTTQMSPSLTPELPHAAAPRTHSLGERQTKKMEKKAPSKQNQHSLTHSLGAAKSISAIEALDSLNLRHHQSPVD